MNVTRERGLDGVPHHVTQRGNGRAQTFFSDADYRAYRAMLAASGDGSGAMDQLENQTASNLVASWWTQTIPVDTLTATKSSPRAA